MNIWKTKKWQSFYVDNTHRHGMHIIYEQGVDAEVHRAISDCAKWLRSKYLFPKRVRIYVKSARRIKAQNGENVCGTFFRPADRNREPYIRLATGDYLELLEERGKDNALACILVSLLHELSHYFQWLNDLNLTLVGEERQATNYSRRIIGEYSETRDHP